MQIKNDMNATMLVGESGFAAKLVELKGAAKHWHRLSHQLIASAVVHAHKSGDIRQINAVLKVMPAGAKTNSMRRYIETFGPVKWSDAKKCFKFHGPKQNQQVDQGDNDQLVGLLTKHWSEFGQKESADSYKPMDLQARILRLITDANKELDGEHKDKSKLTNVEVNALAELHRKLWPTAEKVA